MIPRNTISGVVFDETHGPWETTKSTFEPLDFGRGYYYTYSLLFQYAANTKGASRFEADTRTLPKQDEIFLLKMPSRPLTADFAARLHSWVLSGGKLLVVADHTDLYDSTQHVNPFLEQFGISIRDRMLLLIGQEGLMS